MTSSPHFPSLAIFIFVILIFVFMITLTGCTPALPPENATTFAGSSSPSESSNETSILGFWKASSVYHFNAENQWVLDSQAVPVYSLFLPGEENCPQDGKTYLGIIPPNKCYLFEDGTLTSLEPDANNVTRLSNVKLLPGNVLEIDTFILDQTGAIVQGIRTQNTQSTEEEARANGWPYLLKEQK